MASMTLALVRLRGQLQQRGNKLALEASTEALWTWAVPCHRTRWSLQLGDAAKTRAVGVYCGKRCGGGVLERVVA